jgi:ankyrin repeat protein
VSTYLSACYTCSRLVNLIRFRWVYCQLQRLRRCLVQSVRQILDELPDTLDETYDRILGEIAKENRAHAYRLLQCLTVASRPLRVEELAQVLAIDFAAPGTPRLNVDLRCEDEEEAILLACSSLVAVIDGYGSRVVHFSHFSVKEFLTSDRIANLRGASEYYIQPEAAHTVMAQACLAALLQLEYDPTWRSALRFPLARYAVGNFASHAEFGNVISHIRVGIDTLLDAEKRHFKTWLLALCVRDTWLLEEPPEIPLAAPLYYVARRGFLGMTRHLISKRPQDVNVRVGDYGMQTPLHAAAESGSMQVTKLLLRYCEDMDVRGRNDRTPLHLASGRGHLDTVQVLLDQDADENDHRKKRMTLTHRIASRRRVKFTWMLHVPKTGIRARDNNGQTPLHLASLHGHANVVQLLLGRGADVDAKDNSHHTPLHLALVNRIETDAIKILCMSLLQSGATVNVRSLRGNTPLHFAITAGRYDVVQLLLERGADVDLQSKYHGTPLHLAVFYNYPTFTQLLLESGANVHVRDKGGSTPYQLASRLGNTQIMQLLSDHTSSNQRRRTYNLFLRVFRG